MHLTLSVEELLTWNVEARLNIGDNATMFNLRPSPIPAPPLIRPSTGYRLHFETATDSNGASVLSISASSTESGWLEAYYYGDGISCMPPVTETPPALGVIEREGAETDNSEQGLWIPAGDGPDADDDLGYEPTDADIIDPMYGRSPEMLLQDHSTSFVEDGCLAESNGTHVSDWPSQPQWAETDDVHSSASFRYADSQLELHDNVFCQSSHAFQVVQAPQIPHDPSSAYSPPSPPTTPSSSASTADPSDCSVVVPERAKKRLPCLHPDCNRHFKNDYTRSLHMKAHVSKQRRYPCKRCSLVLSRHHDLMRHEVSKHDVKPAFTCSHCSKPFRSEHNMAKHKCVEAPKIHWSFQQIEYPDFIDSIDEFESTTHQSQVVEI
ncbi:hypothetical protein C8R43DRAFT_1178312 [Mycena crocata]|nr:hypothetical protein C8R43DRAFT_1178312 [Mycena crocata]